MLRPAGLFAFALFASAPCVAAPPSEQHYTELSESQLLDFRYSFPTLAGSYPKLLSTLSADREERYSEALQKARRGAEIHANMEFPFHRHEFWRDWTVAGISWPIIALQSHTDVFTGGAHPNHFSSEMLWSIKTRTAVSFDQMFGGGTPVWRVTERDYCTRLGRERLRRGFPGSVGCPERKELTIIPVDTNSDYKFDTLRIIADPYVAGSYAEGEYRIELPVTQAIVTALNPQYRELFEAQRPQ